MRCAAMPITPEKYFDSIVPRYLARAANDDLREGVLVIRLFGDVGGEWTIDATKRRIRRGGASSPDLYLEMDRADFIALMAADLDVVAAVHGGRIRFVGDIELLNTLAVLLDPTMQTRSIG